MSLIGNARYLTDIDIRLWLRDSPDLNRLLDDYEFTPAEIQAAQTHAVDYWNELPPDIGSYDYTVFPFRFNMLQGTVANLLFIAANSYRRNKLKYDIPGGAISDLDKEPEYTAAAEKLWNEYKQWCMHKKRELNSESAWGTVG